MQQIIKADKEKEFTQQITNMIIIFSLHTRNITSTNIADVTIMGKKVEHVFEQVSTIKC